MIRNLIVKSALIATLLSTWGCALPQKGLLPKAELPAAPAAADIHMTVILTQAVAVTSKQFALYLATGGLSPIRVPCIYDLHAEIRSCLGKDVKYDIKDEVSEMVWAPGWPPGVDWRIDPTSSSVRGNLYRTLMMQMHGDGLLRHCEE